jgi:hypothetical protein
LIRAADAKEVGVGNPAEETYRHPNQKAGNKVRVRSRMSTPFATAWQIFWTAAKAGFGLRGVGMEAVERGNAVGPKVAGGGLRSWLLRKYLSFGKGLTLTANRVWIRQIL